MNKERSGKSENDEGNEELRNESEELNKEESMNEIDIMSTAPDVNNENEIHGRRLVALFWGMIRKILFWKLITRQFLCLPNQGILFSNKKRIVTNALYCAYANIVYPI